jgi:ABC-type amino acid transport substrate-binding protein
MPFAFLAPLFLAGALAIAIPIIVHLTHKEKADVLKFPSLMFVRQIPYRSTRKQRIRHWFLLLLRAMALILVAAAFARPFLEKDPGPLPLGVGAREVVILVDRSYSMGYQGRWPDAVRAATQALDGVQPGDRATLVLFDERADAIRAQEGDLLPLRAALKEASPSALATQFAPGLRLAQSVLQSTELPRKEVLLISDLQRSGWNAREVIELPEGTTFRVTDVGRDVSKNIAVAGVTFARAQFAGAERVVVTARVLNRGVDAETVPVALELNGREVESKPLTVPPAQAATVSFGQFTVTPDLHASVRAGTDALTIDNRFFFLLTPGQTLPVGIVRSESPRSDETLFLERALGAAGEPTYDVGIYTQNIPSDRLRAGGVVILNDATLSGADHRRLRRFIESGGGVLIALGDRSNWRGDAAELIPGNVGRVIDRDPTAPGRVASVQYGHRVFEAFRGPRSGDFTAARIYRYRDLDVGDANAVLARFDDGRPALVEHRLGRGRVLIWASTLDNYWNDLPLQPVFAPFVREAAGYLSGSRADAAWMTAGEIFDASPLLGAVTNSSTREVIVVSPSGKRSSIRGEGGAYLPLIEQGFYQLRPSGNGTPRTVAVNVNVTESDLARVPVEEIRAAVVNTANPAARANAAELTPADHEQRQSFWWYLLLIAAMLLAVESVISNRLSQVSRA